MFIAQNKIPNLHSLMAFSSELKGTLSIEDGTTAEIQIKKRH